MLKDLLNPADNLERQNEKLIKIASVLMQRVEQDTQRSGAAYAQFERSALLEDQVRQRTLDLEHALDLLNTSNAALAEAQRESETAHTNMANAIEAINEGFALFDADEELVMRNSRFGQHMPDIKAQILPGMLFADYVTLASKSSYLAFDRDMTPEAWVEHRITRHHDRHVNFNLHLQSDTWLQISEHRTPNGGTVILQTDVTDVVRLERLERGKLLDDQARMIAATLEHLNQGIYIFDSEIGLMGWNELARTLVSLPSSHLRVGMRFERLLAHLVSTYNLPSDVTERVQTWAHSSAARPDLCFEITRQGTQTGAQTLEVIGQEMPDNRFVMSFTDVTPARAAARALAQANGPRARRVKDRTLEVQPSRRAQASGQAKQPSLCPPAEQAHNQGPHALTLAAAAAHTTRY